MKKKQFRRNLAHSGISLTGRLWIMIFCVCLIITGCVLFGSYLLNNRASREALQQDSETLIYGIQNGVTSNIYNFEDLSRLIMIDEKVLYLLRLKEASAGPINDAHYSVLKILNACDNVDSVFVIRNDLYYMSTRREKYTIRTELMEHPDWVEFVDSKRGGVVLSIDGNGAIAKANGVPVFSIMRSIYDIDSQKKTGYLVMNISTEMMENAIRSQGEVTACIATDNGRYLAGDESLMDYYSDDFLGGEVFHEKFVDSDGNKGIISGHKIQDMPLVILVRPRNQSLEDRNQFTMIFMTAILILLIICMLFAGNFLSRNITRPIIELNDAMVKSKSSGWLEPINVSFPKNEIGALGHTYNDMVENMNDMFTSLIEKEQMLQKAEMSVLHEQIKPHFLYNSLESIGCMALEDGAEDVHTAVETLGSFYRNFLSKGDREIPLKREIRIVQDYLTLQKMRYGDIIHDEYDIDENTNEIMIPKLILQPLVENCIYHGIRLSGEEGLIRISSRLEEDRILVICVRDTGIGMSQEKIEEVLSGGMEELTGNLSEEASRHSSFGLKGTIERIRLYCGCHDIVDIRSVQGEYTEVELRIPLDRGKTVRINNGIV